MPRKGKGKGKGKGKIGRKGKGKGNNRKGKGKNAIRIIHKYADIELKLDNNQKYDVTFKGNKNNFSLVVKNPPTNRVINNPPQVDIPDEAYEIPDIHEIPDEAYDDRDDFIDPRAYDPRAYDHDNDPRAYDNELLPEEAM